MKYRFPFCLLAFFLVFTGSTGLSFSQNWIIVKWVDDGDTIVLKNGIRVRYIGINSPEIAHHDQQAEPYGYAAKRLNKKLVFHKAVRLEVDKERFDRHKRQLAYVFLKTGLFVNAELVRRGYAYCLPQKKNLKYNTSLLNAQRDAMSGKRGMWQNWKESSGRYIGNRASKRFHLPSCTSAKKISKRNRIYFRKRWEAFWEGFAPAKRCLKQYWSYEKK